MIVDLRRLLQLKMAVPGPTSILPMGNGKF